MYFQTKEGVFVLDPKYENDLGSYETYADQIKVLVTNKKDLNKFCKECFESYDAEFDRKIGPFNQYMIILKGPILKFDIPAVMNNSPSFAESVFFWLEVSTKELTSRDYRPELLSSWVLGVEHPTQFNRLLKLNFNVVETRPGFVKVSKKDDSDTKV